MRPITKDEWGKYEWLDVTAHGDADKNYVRGKEYATPPNDGFVYSEGPMSPDGKQTWRRVMTSDN